MEHSNSHLTSWVLFFAILAAPHLANGSEPPRRFGLGLNYGGAQIDWRMSPKWMFEFRAQKGKATADNLETKSDVTGIRAYHLFLRRKSPSPYLGLQLAGVNAKQNNTRYKADGMAAGAFGGLAFHLSPRFCTTNQKLCRPGRS